MTAKRTFFVIMLLLSAVLMASIGGWDLRGHDEPRYSQVAREMLESGNYVVPHLNGQIYSEKPPLFFCLIAASSRLFDGGREGPTPFSARFPSALAGIGILVMLYLLCRGPYGESVALWSVLILFTTPQFISMATDAHLDATLTFWMILALFLFMQGLRQHAATQSRRRSLLFLSAYFAMGLAIVTKGPVGFAVPMITVLLFLLIKRDTAALKTIRPFSGLLVMCSVVALWLVPATLAGGLEYFKIMIFKQNIGRAVNSFAHAQPFYYYLEAFPSDFMPWTLFVPAACIHLWRRRKSDGRLLFPLVWFAGTFVFFSLMSGKRSLYLLPLYPAAAIMMARFLEEKLQAMQGGDRTEFSWLTLLPWYLLFGGFFVLPGIMMIHPGVIKRFAAVSGQFMSGWFYPLLILMTGLGALGIFLVIRKRLRSAFYLFIGLVTATTVFIFVLFYPALDPLYSWRPFSERIRALTTRATPLVTTFPPDIPNYFLHRYPIKTIEPEDIRAELEVNRELFVLHRVNRKERLQPGLLEGLHVLESTTVDHYTYYLLGARPGSSGGGVRRDTLP